MNIKKTEKFLGLLMFLLILLPQITLASSISLFSSTSSVKPDKTFSLSIYVDPETTSSYTAQANIDFPANLVSIESFTYAASWFPISQPGYDSIDNVNGSMVKTAGYPGGFSSSTLFGTAVVKVKSAGSIDIYVNDKSYVLDVDSNNTLDTYGKVTITSSNPIVETPKTTVQAPSTVENNNTPTETTTNKIPTSTEKTNIDNKNANGSSNLDVSNVDNIQSKLNERIKSGKELTILSGMIIGIISAYIGLH